MNTKLTLKLNQSVIKKAKDYAELHKKSLSSIIESYLKSLVNHNNNTSNEEISISPFVKSISTGIKIPLALDYKLEYKEHLDEKYK